MERVDEAVALLRELKALGVRIAVDDFGTGYSSLAYLRQFPVDALKIDRSFVCGIADSGESTALVRAFVQVARTLTLETVAEGIENQAQRNLLQLEHCTYGQGFLFSHPLDVSAVDSFLRTAQSLRQPLLAG